jgi:SPP1 family predicted phage head-tail adaptor
MLDAGTLNKQIIFQYQTKVSDGMGGWVVSWVDVGSPVFAAIWPLSASETVKSMQPLGTITHRVRVRYRSVLKSTWRIRYGDRYFNIVGPPIDPQMAHEYLDILCKEAA